jgi:hypothetical protein
LQQLPRPRAAGLAGGVAGPYRVGQGLRFRGGQVLLRASQGTFRELFDQQQVAALAPERGYLDIPDEEQADLARRLRIGMRLDNVADS